MKVTKKNEPSVLFSMENKHFKKTKKLIFDLVKQQRDIAMGRPTPDAEIRQAIHELTVVRATLITFQIISFMLVLILIAIGIYLS